MKNLIQNEIIKNFTSGRKISGVITDSIVNGNKKIFTIESIHAEVSLSVEPSDRFVDRLVAIKKQFGFSLVTGEKIAFVYDVARDHLNDRSNTVTGVTLETRTFEIDGVRYTDLAIITE